MKNGICLLLFLTIGLVGFSQTRTEADLVISAFKKEKKELVEDFLELPEGKAEKFWEIYDEYETKRSNLAHRRIAMVSSYADKHLALNEADAKAISKEFFALRKGYTKLQKKYHKKMSKVIGHAKALDFVHLEEYVEMYVRSELLDAVPFVGED
jgi:hypothetical protein